MDPKQRRVVIYVVLAVWATNFAVGVISELLGGTYRPSETINGIFATVIGTVVASGAIQRSGKGKHSRDENKQDEEE